MIKIFLDQISQPALAVLTVCKLGKVPFELHEIRLARKEVNLFPTQHKLDDFLQKNPAGQVPIIYDTEEKSYISESHTIMRYLCQKYSTTLIHLYPNNLI